MSEVDDRKARVRRVKSLTGGWGGDVVVEEQNVEVGGEAPLRVEVMFDLNVPQGSAAEPHTAATEGGVSLGPWWAWAAGVGAVAAVVTVVLVAGGASEAVLRSELIGDESFLPLLTEYCHQVLPEVVEQLVEARRQEDLDTIRQVAHRLSGSASSYGFPSITQRARQIEEEIRGSGGLSDLAAVDGLAEEMRAAIRGLSPSSA